MLHQPGRVDEECYAIPGLTILKTGLPQLPHMPSRNPESMFYKADEVLYSEPPLFFYFQACFYALFGPSYAASRIVSIVAGGITLFAAACLARRWSNSDWAGYFTAAFLGLTKWFYYGIILARPDMLCTCLGIVAIVCTDNWLRSRKTRWLIVIGTLIGLAGLTLPLALAIAVQIAGWIWVVSRGVSRWLSPSIVAGVSIAVFATWLIQIAVAPEVFRLQFYNQFIDNKLLVMNDTKPPGWAELVGMSLWSNLRALVMYKGVYQFLLVAIPVVIATGYAIMRRDSGVLKACCLSWSAFVILSLLVGRAHHPGYWAYLGTLLVINLSVVATVLCRWMVGHYGRCAQWCIVVSGLIVVLSLLPGSGARLFPVYLQNWYQTDYQVDEFAKIVLAEIPPDATCLVDRELVLNFIAAGRKTLALPVFPIFFDPTGYHYDYAIVGRTGMEVNVTENFKGTLVKSIGREADEFACFVRIYRRQ